MNERKEGREGQRLIGLKFKILGKPYKLLSENVFPIIGTSFYPISKLDPFLTTALLDDMSRRKSFGIREEIGRMPVE